MEVEEEAVERGADMAVVVDTNDENWVEITGNAAEGISDGGADAAEDCSTVDDSIIGTCN